MKAMYRCNGCKTVFEADADPWSDPRQVETMLSKCPACGRSGSAGSWRQYPEGCMLVMPDRGRDKPMEKVEPGVWRGAF